MMRRFGRWLALIMILSVPMVGATAADLDGDYDVRVDTDNDFDIRPYLGVGMGLFGLEYQDTARSARTSSFGAFGRLGTDVGDYLGAELRLGGVWPSTANGLRLSERYFLSYLGKLQTPVADDLRIYGLLGGTTGKFKKGGTSQTKTGFSFGFGGEYYLQDLGMGGQDVARGDMTVGLEWMQYLNNVKLSSAFGNQAKVKMWGAVATFNYRFH